MAKKKAVVKRSPLKIKKTRKISEEQKEKLRKRLEVMRANKKPAEYKNVAKSVLALPDDDTYSFKNVKEWIKENKLQVSALGQQAKNRGSVPKDKQIAENLAHSKKAYIRYCEYYLKTGDWISAFSGKEEEHKVVPRCVAMAYYPDGRPKRSEGVFYPDISAVWTRDMDASEFPDMRENTNYVPKKSGRVAITDKQFTANL
jgi:hypothetical protein